VHAGREGVAVRDERTQDVAEPLIGGVAGASGPAYAEVNRKYGAGATM
jgi:hypothetical protein